MKCNVVQTRLLRFLDGELSESEQRAITQHVRNCEQCSARLDKLTGVWRSQCPLRAVEADQFAWQKLYIRISALEEPQPRGRLHQRLVNLALAGGLAMLFLLGVVTGIYLGTDPQLVSELSIAEATAEEQFVSMVHIDSFQDAPPGSLGSFYMAVSTDDQWRGAR